MSKTAQRVQQTLLRNPATALLTLSALPLAVWAVFTLPGIAESAKTWWDWRRALILLSGTVLLWWMSAGMLLALRPAGLEKACGGLDRLYRLHKNLGIGAGVLVFTHWLLEWLPKNLAKAGLIERPFRGPRGPRGDANMWMDLAKDIGEWAGYIVFALVLVALIRRIPYRHFRWLHKLFPLAFMAGVYHGLMLMPKTYWEQPLAYLTAALAGVGCIAGLIALSGRIGRNRQVACTLDSSTLHPDGVLELYCRPTTPWPGHKAGQCVLVDFGHPGEGAHPFTLASSWSLQDGRLRLAIKALGDYTRSLPQRLSPGQHLRVEGPYGGFTFAACAKPAPQVWVAGGIGITPFIARLQELAALGGSQAPVDLFYSTAQATPLSFTHELANLCQAAGVRLHQRDTTQAGPLPTLELSRRLRPGASLWFCGPLGWGRQLEQDLVHSGLLPAHAFHKELFEFR